MRRRAGALVVSAALLAGCGSTVSGDRDRDGVSDGWDAHPGQAVEVDRQIERAVRDHAGKPGLVTVGVVGLRVDRCDQSPARAVAVMAADPQRSTC